MSEATVSFVGSTKSEIWKAYQELLKSNNSQTIQTTTEVASTKVKTATVSAANTIVTKMTTIQDDIASSIAILVNLADQYQTVTDAIAVKQAELKDIHNFEIEANSTISLIAAKNQLLADKTTEADTIIKNARQQATEIISAANDQIATIKLEQKRKNDEYAYEFARKSKADQDALQDTLNIKIKDVENRIVIVAEREKMVNDKDAKIAELTAILESKDSAIAAQISAAVETAQKKEATSNAIARSYLEKEHKAETSIKDAKIESLTEKVIDLQEQIAKSAELVAAANKNVSEMAMSALKSQGDSATIAKVSEIAAGANKGR